MLGRRATALLALLLTNGCSAKLPESQKRTTATPASHEAVQLRLALIRNFCNASHAAVWPQAASTVTCQLFQKRKEAGPGGAHDQAKNFPKEKLAADKKLTFESVCAKGTKFSHWKMCKHAEVRKFMLGASAAVAAPPAGAGIGKAKGRGAGKVGGGKHTVKQTPGRLTGLVQTSAGGAPS